MWLLILLAIALAGFVAWKLRVPIVAKLTGQSQSRIKRRLD